MGFNGLTSKATASLGMTDGEPRCGDCGTPVFRREKGRRLLRLTRMLEIYDNGNVAGVCIKCGGRWTLDGFVRVEVLGDV